MRMRVRMAGAMVLASIASIGVVACGGSDSDTADGTTPTTGSGSSAGSATTAAKSSDPVKVMFAGPFSAKDVVPFGNHPAIAEATVKALNARSDRALRRIDLTVCDDAGDPNKNVKCAREAVAKKIDVVVTENVATAVGVKVLAKAKIPVISILGFQAEELTSDNVFNITGGGPGLSGAAAGVLVQGAKPKSIDIIAQTDAQSRAGVKGAQAILASYGAKAPRVTSIDPGVTDLAPAAKASTQGGVDGVIALPQYDILQAYMKAIKQAGVKGAAFATSDLNLPPAVIANLGDAAEGMYIGSLYRPLADDKDPAVARFISDITSSEPKLDPRKEVLPWAAEGVYVALQVAAHAASLVQGDLSAEAVLAALPTIKDYDTGLVAPISYDKASAGFPGLTRLFNTKMLIGRVEGGKVVVADPDNWVDYIGSKQG
jgi:branched-chain amino acid transport system substrate-binding protein